MKGTAGPDFVNPVPEMEIALTVTALPPVELSVTDCVVGVLTVTLPNAIVVAFTLNIAALVLKAMAKLLDERLELAVSVADWELETAAICAVKLALLDPAATVTDPGTATAALLLASATDCPLLPAAALSVTVQLSVPAPENELFAQRTLLTVAPELQRCLCAIALVGAMTSKVKTEMVKKVRILFMNGHYALQRSLST